LIHKKDKEHKTHKENKDDKENNNKSHKLEPINHEDIGRKKSNSTNKRLSYKLNSNKSMLKLEKVMSELPPIDKPFQHKSSKSILPNINLTTKPAKTESKKKVFFNSLVKVLNPEKEKDIDKYKRILSVAVEVEEEAEEDDKTQRIKQEEVQKFKKERAIKNINRVKAIADLIIFYFMVRKVTRENKLYKGHTSLKKFVYHYEQDRVEDVVTAWIYNAIKIPILSIIKTSKLNFDISNEKSEVKELTSEQNDKYIKLEVSFSINFLLLGKIKSNNE